MLKFYVSFSENFAYIPEAGSWTAATSKMERFVIVNGFQALTIITKRSILDVRAVLDPPPHTKLNDPCIREDI